jgi:hypothetical protein
MPDVVADDTPVSETLVDAAHAAVEPVQSWPAVPGLMPLTLDAVQHIAAIEDAAVRNLWITQSYADLARRLLTILGMDQTWCTFAIWASNTAGTSIRGEELPKRVSELLLGADTQIDAIAREANRVTAVLRGLRLLGDLEHSHVEQLVARALQQVAGFIADGNALVYQELAPIFVRFVEHLERDGTPATNDVDAMLTQIGVPTAEQAPQVRLAFEQYALASGELDPRRRAAHVLAGNIAAVLHEQQRLQHDIESALDAGLLDVGDDLCGVVHGRMHDVVLQRIVRDVRARIAPHVEQLWQHVATQVLMTLTVPGETLHLGRDVPAVPGSPLFPAALHTLDVAAVPVLGDLMTEWDPTHGTGVGSAAGDWADLHQRMGYIVTLFRSRQQHLALTVPPFTSDQMSWMIDGEVPPSI